MIVSCPSCSTRYDLADSFDKASAFTITCKRCQHVWKEQAVTDIKEIPSRAIAKVIDHGDEPEIDVRRLVEAARLAQEDFALRRQAKLKRLGGWGSLGLFILAPFAAAALLPETVVAAAPATIGIYEKLGFNVNVFGLDIRHIEQQNTVVDGAHVLMIKGEISNSTNGIRKIPWLRFALNDEGAAELYSWTLDTAARPLRPGETTGFTTRVASPPELAKNLQIRFAHADEIGSIASP